MVRLSLCHLRLGHGSWRAWSLGVMARGFGTQAQGSYSGLGRVALGGWIPPGVVARGGEWSGESARCTRERSLAQHRRSMVPPTFRRSGTAMQGCATEPSDANQGMWHSGLPHLGAGWPSVRMRLISRPAVETEDMMGTTGVMMAWNFVRHFVGSCALSKRRSVTKEGLGAIIFVNSGRTFRCVMGYNGEGPCGGYKDGATEGKLCLTAKSTRCEPSPPVFLAKLSTGSQQHENPH
jgi:hypothetical protein